MRILTVAALAFIALQSAVAGETAWESGWYQVISSDDQKAIIDGPFTSAEDCAETLPDSSPEDSYSCELLETRPSWYVDEEATPS